MNLGVGLFPDLRGQDLDALAHENAGQPAQSHLDSIDEGMCRLLGFVDCRERSFEVVVDGERLFASLYSPYCSASSRPFPLLRPLPAVHRPPPWGSHFPSPAGLAGFAPCFAFWRFSPRRSALASCSPFRCSLRALSVPLGLAGEYPDGQFRRVVHYRGKED